MIALAIVIGALVTLALIVYVGIPEVLAAIAQSGWATAEVVLFHLVMLLIPAAAWRLLMDDRQPLWLVAFARIVRESVNNLIPLAQIGGEVAGARLLSLWRMPATTAAASIIVDLTVETAAQIIFTAFGLGLLAAIGMDSATLTSLALGLGIATALIVGFYVAQRRGLFRLLELLLNRLAASSSWRSLGSLAGLHDQVVQIYGRTFRTIGALGWHLAGWIVGAGEIWIAFQALGIELSPIQAIAYESLVQAVRSAGFFIPMGLGIQEAGYVASATLFGISPELALTVALIKRARDLILGVPAILLWQLVEGRRTGLTPDSRGAE